MVLTVKNADLTLSVETLGAQMMSIRSRDGREYLWQGDSKYWPDRAPVLFPYIARLTKDSYTFRGKPYPMGIHGFAASQEFSLVEKTDTSLVLALEENQETLRQYPFRFRFQVTYALTGSTVNVSYQVVNRSDETMPFGIGGHPGFRVPLEEGETFEDYEIRFDRKCHPDRVGFTEALFLSGEDPRYPLVEDTTLPLRHSLFDEDAIILKNMARKVRLQSRKSQRSVTVFFPDFPYFGIWHCPRSEAGYVCLEPWSSLPSRQDVIEEISCKSDMLQLTPGKTYDTTWTISIT